LVVVVVQLGTREVVAETDEQICWTPETRGQRARRLVAVTVTIAVTFAFRAAIAIAVATWAITRRTSGGGDDE